MDGESELEDATSIATCAEATFSLLSLVPTFSSSFLGFLSALFVRFLGDKRANINDRKQLILKLKDELKSNSNKVENVDDGVCLVNPYETTIWEGAIFSGKVSTLYKLDCYDELVAVYGKAKAANALEQIHLESMIPSGEPVKAILDATLQMRKNLKAQIDKTLASMGDKYGQHGGSSRFPQRKRK